MKERYLRLDFCDRCGYCLTKELSMNTVVVSSKYQVVIPKEIRETVGLKVGTTLEMICYENRIELVPLQPISSLKGIFKGINTTIEREQQDRI
jgi:AbrB family looped-hinge helix DNA binding protein